ncbi:MAG TPA: hypothetical protein VKE51_19910 [Vicinamibacterales bacterium]|nr:hypothetical protein [Vicinamibacterales bacterium]
MGNRLLVRHFLQRFLDHDLISPDADRREVLTITCALIVVSSLFLAFFLAVKFQFNIFLPPGLTALVALDDRFLLISVSMIVMALVAVAEWDALSLDARDTAVLGPLPVPAAAIVRAKFIALFLFAAAFDAGVNLGPTLMRAVAVPVRLPVTMVGGLKLTVAHAASALTAGAFGFVAVLGLREACRALLGPARFQRISAGVQGVLVVCLTTALLLLPGAYSRVAMTWMTHDRVPPAAVPPLWYVGLHETIAGGIIDGLPRGTPPRRYLAAERTATALYRSLWPSFHRLAFIAVVGSIALLAIVAAACVWNNRRLPADVVAHHRGLRGLQRAWLWAVSRAVVRRPVEQAGFFFTLQSLARSAPHRVTIAASAALAFTIVVITLSGNDLQRRLDPASMPLSLLALQMLLIGVVLTGFRHAVRVPAEAGANWIFHLAWTGDETPYLTGVKRAALVALVAPTVLMLLVLDVFTLGAGLAVAHAAFGLGEAMLLLEILFLKYRKLPFASSYVRSEDLKSVGPLYVVGLSTTAVTFAAFERAALASVPGVVAGLGALATLVMAVRAYDASYRRMRFPIDLDEIPSGATQRLELTR